ncbi:MAG: hypothetical protein GQ574_16590 [Crocinitomix sp.]|nr:hypothetical protein [Crocinitomix sp.]
MKTSFALIFVTACLLLTNCRKDPALVGLEPNGNTLVLQLDINYEIEAAAELTLNIAYTDSILDLAWKAVNNCTGSKLVYCFQASNDTVLYFADRQLIQPNLTVSDRMNLKDGRLYTKITTDDFTPFEDSKYDAEQLLLKIGDSRILHGYFDTESGKKISVVSTLINVYSEELQIAIPTRKYFVIAAK